MSATTPIDGSRKGYIRLHRKILENPLFKEKPAGWFKIWVYILLRANWRESVFRPRQGKAITVPAGSLVTSLEKLGTHAGLSKEHARRCLDYLERTHAVTLRRTNHWTMITIMNWATYQQSEDQPQHAVHHAQHHAEDEDTTHETPHRTPRATSPSKEVKNLCKKYESNSDELDCAPTSSQPKPNPTTSRKTSEIDPAVREWFEGEFWPVYPRHEGKSKALQAANTKATTPNKRSYYLASLRAQLPEYNRRKQESGQRVIPLATTWFDQDRAEDELNLSSASSARGLRATECDYPEYVPLSDCAV